MISVKGGGSGNGIAALINKTVDFADASREIKPEESRAGQGHRRRPGRAPRSPRTASSSSSTPANAVTDITKDQLGKVYRGEITNWKDVGGADAADRPARPRQLLRHVRVRQGRGRRQGTSPSTPSRMRNLQSTPGHRRRGRQEPERASATSVWATRTPPSSRSTSTARPPRSTPCSTARYAAQPRAVHVQQRRARRRDEGLHRLDPQRRRSEDRQGPGLRPARQVAWNRYLMTEPSQVKTARSGRPAFSRAADAVVRRFIRGVRMAGDRHSRRHLHVPRCQLHQGHPGGRPVDDDLGHRLVSDVRLRRASASSPPRSARCGSPASRSLLAVPDRQSLAAIYLSEFAGGPAQGDHQVGRRVHGGGAFGRARPSRPGVRRAGRPAGVPACSRG